MSESSTPKKVFHLALALLAIAAAAGGVYLADVLYYRPLREQQQMVANLKSLVSRLTRQTRLAEVAVVAQSTGEGTSATLRTTFSFVEVDADGQPLGAKRTFTVDGDVAYFDTLVIKFKPEFLPLNDARLKAAEFAAPKPALILFRRVFGEKQKPEDGFPLDHAGEAPEVYRTSAPPSAFEQKLWREFWDLAADPQLAAARGVYAAHGDAPYTRLEQDRIYILERNVGGDLTIRPQNVPAVLRR